MINRVVIAGKIVESPRVETKPNGQKVAVLKLQIQHPMWGVAGTEQCTVEVLGVGERRAEIFERYLQAGRDFMVEGHLVDVDGTLRVVVDQFHFMESGLNTRYYHTEGSADPVAA